MKSQEMGAMPNIPKVEGVRANLQRDFQSAKTQAEKLAFLTDPENQEANKSFVNRKMREMSLPPVPERDLAQIGDLLLENKDNPNLRSLVEQFLEKENEIREQLENRKIELENLTKEKAVLDFALEHLEDLYPKLTKNQKRSKKHVPRQIEILAEKTGRTDVSEYIKSNEGEVHFKNVNTTVASRVDTLKQNVDDLTSALSNIEKLKGNI